MSSLFAFSGTLGEVKEKKKTAISEGILYSACEIVVWISHDNHFPSVRGKRVGEKMKKIKEKYLSGGKAKGNVMLLLPIARFFFPKKKYSVLVDTICVFPLPLILTMRYYKRTV